MSPRARLVCWAMAITLVGAAALLWQRYGETVFIAGLGGWIC
jgi:hypothetical protein